MCSIRNSVGGGDLLGLVQFILAAEWCLWNDGRSSRIGSIDTCALGRLKVLSYVHTSTHRTMVDGKSAPGTDQRNPVSQPSDLPYYFVIENNKLYIRCICVSIARTTHTHDAMVALALSMVYT